MARKIKPKKVLREYVFVSYPSVLSENIIDWEGEDYIWGECEYYSEYGEFTTLRCVKHIKSNNLQSAKTKANKLHNTYVDEYYGLEIILWDGKMSVVLDTI